MLLTGVPKDSHINPIGFMFTITSQFAVSACDGIVCCIVGQIFSPPIAVPSPFLPSLSETPGATKQRNPLTTPNIFLNIPIQLVVCI